jgi:hypothetical protein
MFFGTSKVIRTKPLQSIQPITYQKAFAAKKNLFNQHIIRQKSALVGQKNESIKQKLTTIESLPTTLKGSWGWLFAALGLGGWLWHSMQDEQSAKKEADAILIMCRRSSARPLNLFVQFIKKYGSGIVAEQLFEHMIADDTILFNMYAESRKLTTIPASVTPFIKRYYYTLACSNDGSYLLTKLMNIDNPLKKELTIFAIRDMEKLCKDAQTDVFFRGLMINNPEAIKGLVEKAEGHVEELIATQAGKQLIDNNLIQHSLNVAKERAILLVDPSKNFDLRVFNTCMTIIKDDPVIENKIYTSYKDNDFASLLKKIVYQKYCQHCTKDDLSHASVSLKMLSHRIDYLSSVNTIYEYIVPDKGLSRMVIDALHKEGAYKDNYYIFYHGQPSKLGFQQRLFSWLVTKKDDMILPVIYPLPQTKQEKDAEIIELSKRMGSMAGYGGERIHNLYAVINLFSNITLSLAATNSSPAPMPIITTQQAFTYAHQEQIYTEFKNELKALEHEYNKLHQKGQLLQFRVKKDQLEQYVFPSNDQESLQVEGTGKVFDIRSIMSIFNNNPEKIINSNFSVGISIGSFLSDPNSGITCSIINSADPNEWAVYEKKEHELRNKIDRYLETSKNPQPKSYMNIFK